MNSWNRSQESQTLINFTDRISDILVIAKTEEHEQSIATSLRHNLPADAANQSPVPELKSHSSYFPSSVSTRLHVIGMIPISFAPH